jgi:tripartite-type tricarboxylate transporter receptor subunit TctC
MTGGDLAPKIVERTAARMMRICAVALATMLLTPLWATRGQAQDYPARPIRFILGFAAGGTTDFIARILAEKLRAPLGQAVVVDNKPGANGAIAAEYVARSEPDGYTLFFTTVGAVAINPGLRNDLRYDPIRDFFPVSLLAFNSTMLVVNAAMPVDSARALAALARQKPGAITIGVTGIGRCPIWGSSCFNPPPASSSRRCPIGAPRRR